MLQSGYFADRILPIMLDAINGLSNESNRLRRPADPKFTRLVELMREGQLAGAIQIRIERPKDGGESSALIFGPSKDPELAAKGRELKSILGIKPELRELRVNYGGYSGKDDEIDMMTRSMLQIIARIRGHRAGAGGRCRPGEGRARAGRHSGSRSAERSAFTGAGHRYTAAGRLCCRSIRPAMVLDRRHRHPVKIHLRHHHAAVLDRRYGSDGVGARCHHTRQPVTVLVRRERRNDVAIVLETQ